MKKLLEPRRTRMCLIAGESALVLALMVLAAVVRATSSTPSAPGTISSSKVSASKDAIVFMIDPSGTTASFSIGEVLFGTSRAVVGTTDQVAGQGEMSPGERQRCPHQDDFPPKKP